MAYCPKCGTKSPNEAKFCNVCGTPLPQDGQGAQAPHPQQPQADKALRQQPSPAGQPIQAPFPQQPSQITAHQLPPQGMPPGFNYNGTPPKKRSWSLFFLGLLIVLAGLYYIGSAPEAKQPSPAQPVTQPQNNKPQQGNAPEAPGQATPQVPPSGTARQQPGSKNIVGRQAKIAYLEKIDLQANSIMQGVTRGAGQELLTEISQLIEDINQTTLDSNDEDEEALELLVLEISRMGCACEAITDPNKKAKALQEESRLHQEFTQKFQAYKQSKST